MWNSTGHPDKLDMFPTSVWIKRSTNCWKWTEQVRVTAVNISLLKNVWRERTGLFPEGIERCSLLRNARTHGPRSELLGPLFFLQVSGLKQSVFGGEPLHALPLQKLHGSPVDLAAVLWLPERSELLLDVLQPQICRGNSWNELDKDTCWTSDSLCPWMYSQQISEWDLLA